MLSTYTKVTSYLATRKNEDKAATAVEYALLIGLLSIVLVGALVLFGEDVTGWIDGLWDGATATNAT